MNWKSLLGTSLVAFAMILGSQNLADGHEWTIGKDQRKVEAELVGFDGKNVLLENTKGKQKSFPVADLSQKDLEYLATRLQIRNAVVQEQYAKQQLQQLRIQAASNFADIWEVLLIAPNGEQKVVSYFARDSRDAAALALNDYPFAQVGASNRLRRRNFGY